MAMVSQCFDMLMWFTQVETRQNRSAPLREAIVGLAKKEQEAEEEDWTPRGQEKDREEPNNQKKNPEAKNGVTGGMPAATTARTAKPLREAISFRDR